MITGKDQMKVKCFKGALMQSKRDFENLAADLKLIINKMKLDDINVNSDPYWRLAYDLGVCEEMARICGNELKETG